MQCLGKYLRLNLKWNDKPTFLRISMSVLIAQKRALQISQTVPEFFTIDFLRSYRVVYNKVSFEVLKILK